MYFLLFGVVLLSCVSCKAMVILMMTYINKICSLERHQRPTLEGTMVLRSDMNSEFFV